MEDNSIKIIYTCPMHPEITENHPGICPECGMNLVPVKGRNGKLIPDDHDKHAGHSTRDFLKKFWLSLILTVPVVLYSELPIEKFFGFRPLAFPNSNYLVLVLSSIVFFYGGWIFTIGAYRELRAKMPGMMTLIGLAVWTAYLFSVFQIIIGETHTLFWELTTLITVMLLGHWIEMQAVKETQRALKELSRLLPDVAEIIRDGKNEIIPLSQLKEGDFVLVRPGGKISADGIVMDGQSEVNESLISGESAPVSKTIGKEVIAGSINGDGMLKIRVTKIGDRTFLAGVMRLVKEAQASKSKLQMLSDRAAFYLTLIAISAGGLTFILWMFSKAGFAFSLERLVSVLVIACPHALGLAVPLVASISTTLAARNGFLVRQRLALESARNINMVLFDKTGTLTKGEFGIDRIWPINDENNEAEILKKAASIDTHSEHFISKAIVNKAEKNGLGLYEVKDFSRISGKGVGGIVNGKVIQVGGQAILENTTDVLPEKIKEEVKNEAQKGKTLIYVLEDKRLIGLIALSDVIREESKQAIEELKKMQVKVTMLTGDSKEVAQWVATELKIDDYFARVLPNDKAEKVKFLQKKGYQVAMVGDGINDAPALTQADIGIAIGAGTNVAIESAGIILIKNDPRDIPKIIRLSKATYRKMIHNLFWATGYNLAALPLAAGIFASQGILLQPAFSAILMSLSTVIVAFNALFLMRIDLNK